MKRFALIGVTGLVIAGTALAGTLSVPFFLDNAPDTWSGGWPTTNRTATFIGLKNNTGSTITVTVTYTDNDGTDATPSPNTFNLLAGQGISYRPCIDDSVQEDANARLVPNKTGATAGSSVYTWTGANSDITIRLYEKHGAQTSAMSNIWGN